MTKRAPDWWLSAWDEYGESFDTNRIIQITAGVLAPYRDPAVAISVAGETPIKLSHEGVARFREYLDWAVEEHRMLQRAAADDPDADGTDGAVLDHAQWQSVMAALQNSPSAHPEALDMLKASAPPAWLPDINDHE